MPITVNGTTIPSKAGSIKVNGTNITKVNVVSGATTTTVWTSQSNTIFSAGTFGVTPTSYGGWAVRNMALYSSHTYTISNGIQETSPLTINIDVTGINTISIIFTGQVNGPQNAIGYFYGKCGSISNFKSAQVNVSGSSGSASLAGTLTLNVSSLSGVQQLSVWLKCANASNTTGVTNTVNITSILLS